MLEYFVLAVVYLIPVYFIAWGVGRHKKIGFWPTIFISLIFSPFIGFIVAEASGLKKPKGCKWCGNKDNEAVYCGICNKNDEGNMRPGL